MGSLYQNHWPVNWSGGGTLRATGGAVLNGTRVRSMRHTRGALAPLRGF